MVPLIADLTLFRVAPHDAPEVQPSEAHRTHSGRATSTRSDPQDLVARRVPSMPVRDDGASEREHLMKNTGPVVSPLLSYGRIGVAARSICRKLRNSLRSRRSRDLVAPRIRAALSRDLPLPPLPHTPRPPHRRRTPVAVALVLLICLSACAPAGDAPARHFLILKLPASVALLALAFLGCGLAGFGLGLVVALQLLRAANSAASQYHRAEVARILSASSAVHAVVQEVVRAAHTRIHELRRLLASVQQGGAR